MNKAPKGGDASPDAKPEMSSHQKLVAPHFAAQFPIQMKRAFEKGRDPASPPSGALFINRLVSRR